MAHYYLVTKSLSRSAGRSAPAAAAYRAGERIRDERTGELHNYSRRTDVSHREILLPSALKEGQAAWARDRARLWNTAEAAEGRRNSRVAREYQVTLPHELNVAQRRELARLFSRELADRHNIAVDLAIHEPKPNGDPRNYHAHLLVTTREVGSSGLGAKAGLDLSFASREQRGLAGYKELSVIRERWATLTNEAYRSAGLEARVDHRSLAAQGIDREPLPYIPFVAYQMERRGLRSEVAEGIRERHRERVAARAARQDLSSTTDAVGLAPEAPAPSAASTSGTDELRRRAREAWLALRRSSAEPSASPSKAEEHAADEDLSL
jgi:ATP-dependent exoDNAse (exonuclease V) alpha subunit